MKNEDRNVNYGMKNGFDSLRDITEPLNDNN
jgi:hypothetical protein